MKKILVLFLLCFLFGYVSLGVFAENTNSNLNGNLENEQTNLNVKTLDSSKSTESVDKCYDYKITIYEKIEVDKSKKNINITGTIKWFDENGNERPVQDIVVHACSDGYETKKYKNDDDEYQDVHTNENGEYSMDIPYNFVVFKKKESSCIQIGTFGADVYLKIYAENNNKKVLNYEDSSCYSFTTDSIHINQKSNIEKNYVLECTDNVDNPTSKQTNYSNALRAIRILQIMNVGWHYYKHLDSDEYEKFYTQTLNIFYPTYKTYDVSCFKPKPTDSVIPMIYITSDDESNYDTILHEFGHYIQYYKLTTPTESAGTHYIMENLTEKNGKKVGINGAWNEAFAHYFSISSQIYYDEDPSTQNISDIEGVADYKLTIDDTTVIDLENYEGYTDGDELAIASILLNLTINSKIGLTKEYIWEILKKNKIQNLSDFMNNLYSKLLKSSISSQEKYEKLSAIGYYLERNNVVDGSSKYLTSEILFLNRDDEKFTFYFNAAKTKDNLAFFESAGSIKAYTIISEDKDILVVNNGETTLKLLKSTSKKISIFIFLKNMKD